ncbi:hypothetical protein FIU92_00635 [Ruegeria sp. THAF33]|nr:hypothetical protein FIU92_00635 [Ruegeria sp. THAF33]
MHYKTCDKTNCNELQRTPENRDYTDFVSAIQLSLSFCSGRFSPKMAGPQISCFALDSAISRKIGKRRRGLVSSAIEALSIPNIPNLFQNRAKTLSE